MSSSEETIIDSSCQLPCLVDIECSNQPDTAITQLCAIDHTAYNIARSYMSEDKATRYVECPDPCENVQGLCRILGKQSLLPPRPIVRLRGTHTDTVYTWGNLRVDFDIYLDMAPLIMPTPTVNLTLLKIQGAGKVSEEESLQHWMRRFCEGQEDSLMLQRSVTNWNTSFIEQQLRELVEMTQYKGNVDVTFPVQHSRLVITKSTSGAPSAQDNPRQWSSNIRSISAFDAASGTPRCVIESIWPYASSSASPDSSPYRSRNRGSRQFAVQSEAAWLETWREPIRNAVISRKQGWVTVEDLKDVTMSNEHLQQPLKPWGTIANDWKLAFKAVNLRGRKKTVPENFVRGPYRGVDLYT